MKIDAGLLLLGAPIRISRGLQVYHPTIRDMLTVGSERFGSLCGLYNIQRKDILPQETDETWNMSNWEVIKKYFIFHEQAKKTLRDSIMFFLHKKVEFLKLQNTIFVGELEKGIELTEEIFFEIRDTIKYLTMQNGGDGTENAPTSKKAQEIREKIRKSEAQLKKMRDEKGESTFNTQILGVVAHGHSYESVFDMTLVQFRKVLEKIVEIENYEMATMLSPHVSKKHKQKTKHWL